MSQETVVVEKFLDDVKIPKKEEEEWYILRQTLKMEQTRRHEKRVKPIDMSKKPERSDDPIVSSVYWLYKFSIHLYNNMLVESGRLNKDVRLFIKDVVSSAPTSISQDVIRKIVSNVQSLLKSRDRSEKQARDFFADFYYYIKDLLLSESPEEMKKEMNIAKRHLRAGQLQTKNLAEETALLVTSTKQFYTEFSRLIEDTCSATEYRKFLSDLDQKVNSHEKADISLSSFRFEQGGDSKERYCVCGEGFYGKMIACDSNFCTIEWYHYECIGVIRKPKGQWFCPICSDVKDIEKENNVFDAILV